MGDPAHLGDLATCQPSTASSSPHRVNRKRYPATSEPTTPDPLTADTCDPARCQLPECYCSPDGTRIPGDLDPADTPQMVLLSFDGALNTLNFEHYAPFSMPRGSTPTAVPSRPPSSPRTSTPATSWSRSSTPRDMR
ncbi:Cda4 [Cordylochernes scorpioides]|uniref:Cda4 n=1 Tax=Cordylochernes scorpioides TaxID=51811 RepID=A0ABY6KX67_9ARAC|nr:Cda4 [Cordylochernes scorpioides]